MKNLCIAVAALQGLMAGSAFALPPLAELEAQLALSPESRMYDQADQAARAQLKAGRINLGVSLYANAGLAANRDIIDPTHSYAYRETAAGLGLSVPVLGSRMQLRSGLDDQELQVARLDARRELQHRDLLRRLRKAYADYWQAQRTQVLDADLLADETTVRRALDLRTRAGLLLDSDRLELESGFDLGRRDSALAAAAQAHALDSLRSLTDSELDNGVAAPPLHSDCTPANSADARSLDTDPELMALQHIVAVRSNDPRASALYEVQSSVQVGYQGRDEMNTRQHGSSAAVTWTVQVPIGYQSQRRLYSQAAAAELARARLEYEVRRRELQNERHELVQRQGTLRESLQFASVRLAAADAAVEERQLRARDLAGDVIEQLQRARLARYNAAKAVTEAETALVVWYSDSSRFDDFACASAAAVPASESDAAPARRTLYVWRAADWLAEAAAPSGDADLARLRAAGFSRLLVSLDAQQMAHALGDPKALAAAVRATQRHGLQVGLLLGDPIWIQETHRHELLQIVRQFKDVPFDALHLDLEPEQIEPNATADPKLFMELVATLQAVVDISPWPVELSTHPRNLDVPVGEVSFAETLRGLQIEPTLMVYVANPERAVAIVAPLLKRFPRLRFRVALSLEQSAAAEQSLSAYPEAELQRRLAQIERQLHAQNFDGIALQLEDGWSLARPGNGG